MFRFAGPSGYAAVALGLSMAALGGEIENGPPRARGPPSVSVRPPEAYAPDSTQRSQSRALDPSRTQ